MSHAPNDIYTVDVIEAFVDQVRNQELITTVSNVGDTWTIFTDDTHDMSKRAEVEIDSVTYAIFNVVEDVSFDITSTTPITGSVWKAKAPYYYHGTPQAVNALLKKINSTPKYPCIYLHEIFNEKEDRTKTSNVLKTVSMSLFFMADANSQSLTLEQHSTLKAQPMQNLKEFFVKALEASPNIGLFDSDNVIPRTQWGTFQDSKGNPKSIFDDQLSGVELKISLPILRYILNCDGLIVFKCPECPPGGGGGTVNVNQSDGDLIANVVGTTPSANFNVADSPVKSTGVVFSDSVQATDTYTIADNTFTDSDGSNLTSEYGLNIVCTPTVVKSGIIYQRPIYGGQTTEFASGDASSNLDAGLYDYTPVLNPVSVAQLDNDATNPVLTLLNDNTFGDKKRLVDEIGGQTFGSGVGTDCLTGLMWQLVPDSPNSWLSALTNTAASTLAGFSDWRLPTTNELLSLANYFIGSGGLDYTPFDQTLEGDDLWSNETFPNDTLRAYVLFFNLDAVDITININRAEKTALVRYMMVRTELST